MFFRICGKNQKVVKINNYKIQSMKNFVHESLKRLSRIAQTETHEWEFKQSKWGYDCCLTDV
jgi:hypothetical protein